MFSTETYIKDYNYANRNIITSNTEITNYNIPSNFKCCFKACAPSISDTKVIIGRSGQNYMSFGLVTDNSNNGIVIFTNTWGVYTNSISYTFGTEIDVEFTYIDGVMTFTALGNTITVYKTMPYRDSFILQVPAGYLKDICVLEL